ncbi:MAG TPA: 50S ribosome-binding GTPase [Methanoregulaceae archaeon]|nr:50S ribosome-binding GTPase [Methanolinea sp.]MDD3090056.1 50S ribosome-binding GTPase [Methanoregulaceae archaeon]MDD5047522.1 50S ribosome-binding GTPase [Methanoregulaceae archaeon]MDD5684650.1 50S ribosome-binding GTPase [Methanoregulaceae archaeon]HOP66602.1 50S ribosome-binding GTPase [Methanoregulaceae archaeon]
MEFEKIPTVPTADEVLDRCFRRAAAKMKEKKNKDRANEEFVRAVSQAIHDRLVRVMRSFPEFETLAPFYRDTVDILWGIDRVKKALGGVGWAARWARTHGPGLAYQTRKSETPQVIRKRAVARLSSVVHQIDDDLRFLNDIRNVLRKLPHVEDEFTVVIAGYPNVGKSSFIRLVSSATPEVASYPFTTKGIIVGHRMTGRERMQFIDTPGVLDRPAEERNAIERQALTAVVNLADVILCIIDATEHCGYPIEEQVRLIHEIESLTDAPVLVVANKSDLVYFDGYLNMSTETGEGISEVVDTLMGYREKKVSDEKGEGEPC